MRITSKQARAAAVASAFGLAAILGACGDDEETPTVATTTTEAGDATDTTAEPGADELQIAGAWARTSPSMATAGAVYLVIDNPTDSDDVLLSASVDPEIAATVELHESKMADDSDDMSDESDGDMDDAADMNGSDDMSGGSDDMGDDDMPVGGMMTMTPVDQISVPAGSSVALEPGGLHIMLLDLAAPLEAGTTIEVTLTFENAGEVVVNADVQDTAP